MVKSDLLNELAASFPAYPHKEMEEIGNDIIETMINSLCEGKRVEIRGWGALMVKYQKPRANARNPKNGDIVQTGEKFRPHYKAGLLMRDRVNASLQKTPIKHHKNETTAHISRNEELMTEEE